MGRGSRTPIFALLSTWRAAPTPARARTLCDALRARPALAASVVPGLAGELLEHHGDAQDALVALARLMLATDHFEESIDVLVSAGRLDPSARAPYRLLGEALLRRGDAVRAERLLEHAVGSPRRDEEDEDDDAVGWLRLSKVLQRLQATRGEDAVAEEMARRLPPPIEVHLSEHDEEVVDENMDDEATTRMAPVRPEPEDTTSRTVHAIDAAPAPDDDDQATLDAPFDAAAAAAELEMEIEVEVDDDEFPTNAVRSVQRDSLDGKLEELFEKSTVGRRPR